MLTPKPDPSIPIYVGGHSEAAQQLAAELADVYLVWADGADWGGKRHFQHDRGECHIRSRVVGVDAHPQALIGGKRPGR